MNHSKSPLLLLSLFTFGCEPKGVTDPNDAPPDTAGPEIEEERVVWDDKRHGTSVTFQDAHAVGSQLIVVTTDGQTWRHAEDTWTNLPLNVDEEDINGIWGGGGVDNLKMVGVGAAGVIIDWTGTNWDISEHGTALFQAVDGDNINDLIAVGGAGPWRNVSGEWTADSELGHEKFSDVWYNGTTGLAVGDDGKIAWLIDGEWILDEVDVDVDLYGVSGVDYSEIWVAGARGTLLKWNGTAWQSIELDTNANMWSVWAPAAVGNLAFVVGANGEAYKIQGTVVEPIHTGVDNILYSVTGTNETNVWATGGRGVALRYSGE